MDDQCQDATLQQLVMWKDKYSRLAGQHAVLLNQNQELEDRLINVVDKIERDKSLLSDEIDHLAEKLACATNTIDYMKNECARYKSDCMLAVHLLQCQPSFYSMQHLSSLPAELKEKLCSETSVSNDGSPSNKASSSEKKIVKVSTSAMTFPPTAIFLPSNEPTADETPPEEPDIRHHVRDVFLNKIRLAPEYQTEKLIQCPKCGYAVVKYDRCTQTAGELFYMPNSRSAPHLHAMDGDHESETGEARRKRLSTVTSIGGDLLIDFSDIDRTSAPESPTFAQDTVINISELSHQQQQGHKQQVRFNVSPGVHHYHRSTNMDSANIHVDTGKRREGNSFQTTGARYEQVQKEDYVK